MQLVIGNKNYSSWSLRPWLLLSHFNILFEEIRIPLYQAGSHRQLAEYSPSMKVPVLIDGDLSIWDSMAIAEYVSENLLDGRGWPSHMRNRAVARAYCAEMHAEFRALRTEMPMNCRAARRVHLSEQAQRDVRRIDGLWEDALDRHDGPWLFGDFSIADCMFAPVVSRFATYRVEVSEASEQYMKNILTLPAMQRWYDAAIAEQAIIAQSEVGSDVD
jgi:glutathione S-transferase